jgi:hypothetical protein
MFEPSRAYPLLLLTLVPYVFTHAIALVYLTLGLVALLIIAPQYLRLPTLMLEATTQCIGTAASNLVLGIIFVIFIVPYSLLFRLVERKTVHRFFTAEGEQTFYSERKYTFPKEDFDKPW